MSKENLLSALDESESSESEKNIDNARMKQITEKLRYKFSNSKINEIRKKLYEIENKKNLSKSKMKKTEKNMLELEESLSKIKKYYDYDDVEYKGIRDVGNLIIQLTDEDYY